MEFAFNFKTIFDLLNTFPTEQACINHMEAVIWKGVPVSPFDIDSKVYKCSGNRYRCKNTGKYFNIKVGTVMENSNIPLQKWFMALYILGSHKKGISSHQLARDIGVTQKSAWFLLHRLRYAFDHPNHSSHMLKGEVEIDETLVGGKEKNKHAGKKTKGTQGNSTKTKTAVLGIKQRDGNIYACVVSDKKATTLLPIIRETVAGGTVIYTDELPSYNGLSPYYSHGRVHHAINEYVNGKASVNGVENFWSHLKRGLDGIYHWASHKHMNQYVSEFVFRYNTRKEHTAFRFNRVLANIDGRLTYKQLIGDGQNPQKQDQGHGKRNEA